MKKFFIILFLFTLISGFLSGCAKSTDSSNSTEGKTYYFDEDGNMSTTKPKLKIAEKLEVYYFHRTARCYSCNTAGEYISSLINDKYSQEVRDGKIIFGQLDVQKSENRNIARKFQATGSSLYFNRIIDGKDNISQETKIWRLLGNETQFKSYLGNMIDSYLGI